MRLEPEITDSFKRPKVFTQKRCDCSFIIIRFVLWKSFELTSLREVSKASTFFLGGTTPHTFLKTKMSPEKCWLEDEMFFWVLVPFQLTVFHFFFVYIFYFPPVSYQQKSWKFRRHRSSQPTRGSSKVHLETTSLMGSTPLERRFVGGLVGTKFSQICHWKPGPFFFFGVAGKEAGSSGPNFKIFEVRCCCFFGPKQSLKNWKTKMLKKFVSERTCRIQSFPKKSFIWNTQLGSW